MAISNICPLIVPCAPSMVSSQSGNTLVLGSDNKFFVPASGGGDMYLSVVQTVTGAKTFNNGKFLLAGATSGALTINAADTTTPYAVKFPSAQGAVSSVLTNDGSGNLSWSTAGAVTTVNASGTLTIASRTLTNGESAIDQASPITVTNSTTSNRLYKIRVTIRSAMNIGSTGTFTGGPLYRLALNTGTYIDGSATDQLYAQVNQTVAQSGTFNRTYYIIQEFVLAPSASVILSFDRSVNYFNGTITQVIFSETSIRYAITSTTTP